MTTTPLLRTYGRPYSTKLGDAVERVLNVGPDTGTTGAWLGGTVLLVERDGRVLAIGQGHELAATWHPEEVRHRTTGEVLARLDRVPLRELQGAQLVTAVGFQSVYWKEIR